jgi:hypothetical protein
MNNIVGLNIFLHKYCMFIIAYSSRKDRKPPSGYTVGLRSSSQGLVRLLYSREPSQSGPDVIINKVLMTLLPLHAFESHFMIVTITKTFSCCHHLDLL